MIECKPQDIYERLAALMMRETMEADLLVFSDDEDGDLVVDWSPVAMEQLSTVIQAEVDRLYVALDCK